MRSRKAVALVLISVLGALVGVQSGVATCSYIGGWGDVTACYPLTYMCTLFPSGRLGMCIAFECTGQGTCGPNGGRECAEWVCLFKWYCDNCPY